MTGQCAIMPWDISRFTIPQLMCLGNEDPPGKKPMKSAAEFKAYMEQRQREEKEWTDKS